ncbi:MAG TPA: response regulator [Gemmataceae bacterium]|nr:response regulator [Gemmataceae bacterium]
MGPVQQKKVAGDRPVEILLIEDAPIEARRTIRALRKGLVRCRVTVVEDGEEALRLLHQPAFRPDLILLDWYLPKKNGREVLAEIKNDPELRQVPIVVLTISDRQEDIAAAYNGHANSFVTKPVNPEQFARTMKLIEVFWKGRGSSSPENPAPREKRKRQR